MAWISVSGACSRAGKTALCESLLRALPAGSAAALKFTTTDDVFERCPRGTPCVVCDIAVPFRLITDTATLHQEGTDTQRLARAGAAPVVWAIAKAGALRPAWQAAQQAVRAAEWVVMEGSTIVDLAAPALHVCVVHPWLAPTRWKATTPARVADADVVVVNVAADAERGPAPEVRAALVALRGRDDLYVADVRRPLASWAPQLSARLHALRGTPNDADHRRA